MFHKILLSLIYLKYILIENLYLLKKKYPLDVNINKNILLQIQSISDKIIFDLLVNIVVPIISNIFFQNL